VARILVIDDDRAVSSSLGAMLEYEEFDVVIADDGRSGVAAAQSAAFDLIIIDIFMPGMDGLDTIRAIRVRDAVVPIIAISGFTTRAGSLGEAGVLARAVELGATLALEKPFRRREIIGAVKSCMETSQRASRDKWEKTDAVLL